MAVGVGTDARCHREKIVFFVVFVLGASGEILCPTKEHRCLPLSKCRLQDLEGGFLYPCHSGLHLVCCPPPENSTIDDLQENATALESRKTSLFPINCGRVLTADKITGGDKADLGQFPWMALLGYRNKETPIPQFLCGGSVITENYILTAAHCINIVNSLELAFARLGELNLTTEIDCVSYGKTRICGERYVDYTVERALRHPNFSMQKLENDIALIRVREKIKFTEYIRPICLPFGRNLETRDLTLQNFTISGWGKTDPSNLGNAQTLQFTTVQVWNQTWCSESVPRSVKPIKATQLCANGRRDQDACKGDSGGPLVNATIDTDGELRFFQVGLVSFASSVTCGNPELPTVYTRIDKFLQWIVDNVS